MSNDGCDAMSDDMSDKGQHAHDEAIAAAWREAVAAEPGDAPPPALDARILAAARAAVQPVPRRPRYAVPLALAATVVMAVGLGLRQTVPVPQRERAVVGATQEAAAVDGPAAAAAPATTTTTPAAARDSAAPGAGQTAVAPSRRTETKSAAISHADEAAASRPAAAPPALPGSAAAPPAQDEIDAEAARRTDALAAPAAARASGLAAGEAEGAAPETVIDVIRAALARGDRAEAAVLLHDFLVRYPQFPLPSDLAGLRAESQSGSPAR